MPSLQLRFRYRPGQRPDVGALCATVQSVFSANAVGVQFVAGDAEESDLPAMTAVAVGACVDVFDEHKALFDAMASSMKDGQAAIFVVGRITDAATASGCAAHPASCPGAVITEAAAAAGAGGTTAGGRWVLAHEVGHLLGLSHVKDTPRLMCDPPTSITSASPRLSATEKQTVAASPLLGTGALETLALAAPVRSVRGVGQRRVIKRRRPAPKGRRDVKARAAGKPRTAKKRRAAPRRGPRKRPAKGVRHEKRTHK
jgi:hypothetical protein